jgi:citrate lyase subunit beta / citryl-CoA lyase
MRSMLFAPGNHARRVEKVGTVGADAVILDLEDAVPDAEKVATRAIVRAALPRVGTASRRYVRVNAMDTGLAQDDLAAVIGPDLEGIVLPKVQDAGELLAADRRMGGLEDAAGLARGTVDLIPLVETATGVLAVADIARAAATTGRVRKIGFGAGDFRNDVASGFGPVLWDPEGPELVVARSMIVLASRAAGLQPPLDTVWLDVRDHERHEQDARAAQRLGFDAKMAIHPDQLEVIHRVFSPTDDEVARARRVVEAFEAAEAQGSAAIVVDGQLVDYPIVIKARWVLERAAR